MEIYKKQVLRKLTKSIYTKPSRYWEELREKNALKLFHLASQKVPAYRDFLKKNKIKAKTISNFKALSEVPTTNKDNYLRKYPLESLVWEGSIKKRFTFTSTSGSTGEPFYFPRKLHLDQESSVAHELFLRQGLYSNDPVLIIDGFSMGVWIGGLITYNAFTIASNRVNLPISLITAGINKHEILKALSKLAPKFKSTIITGYPPFIKDIVDAAEYMKINLKKLNIRFLFAAELFSEKFRNHVAKSAGVKNIYLDTMNIYGSADIGTMAFESPVSILIREMAVADRRLQNALFGTAEKLPTLAQFNPEFIDFREEKGHIVLTGDSGIPLLRYEIGDNGGVSSYEEVMAIVRSNGVDFSKLVREKGLKKYLYRLPFVYIFERSDFSTTLYGLQIYPETIKIALLDKELTNYLTGRFTMITRYSSKQDQYLEINIELKEGKKQNAKLHKLTLKKIINTLRARNAEFKELLKFLGNRAHPKLIFFEKDDPKYFKSGVKQIWTKKSH